MWGKLQFSDKQLQIADRRDGGAQNFNFAPKSPPKVDFSSKFGLFEENFWIRRTFPNRLKFRGELPPPPGHNTTGTNCRPCGTMRRPSVCHLSFVYEWFVVEGAIGVAQLLACV